MEYWGFVDDVEVMGVIFGMVDLYFGDLFVGICGVNSYGVSYVVVVCEGGVVVVVMDVVGVEFVVDVGLFILIVDDLCVVFGELVVWVYCIVELLVLLFGMIGINGKIFILYLFEVVMC